MRMEAASVSQGTVEMPARIFAHSDAAVKANVSMVLAYAWLGLLVWIAVYLFVALGTVIATSQMCASAIKVGQALIVVFRCRVLTQSAQAMALVQMVSVNVSLDGKAQSVRMHL